MNVKTREEAWAEANKIFPTDYEKDESSSEWAGYDIYRHPTLNYYCRKARLHPCKLMASYEEGTLTISTPEIGMMVSVRLDEAMAVLMEAAAASHDAKGEEALDVQKDAAAQG